MVVTFCHLHETLLIGLPHFCTFLLQTNLAFKSLSKWLLLTSPSLFQSAQLCMANAYELFLAFLVLIYRFSFPLVCEPHERQTILSDLS